jgi:hypothetical protein
MLRCRRRERRNILCELSATLSKTSMQEVEG